MLWHGVILAGFVAISSLKPACNYHSSSWQRMPYSTKSSGFAYLWLSMALTSSPPYSRSCLPSMKPTTLMVAWISGLYSGFIPLTCWSLSCSQCICAGMRSLLVKPSWKECMTKRNRMYSAIKCVCGVSSTVSHTHTVTLSPSRNCPKNLLLRIILKTEIVVGS